jgi:ABC-type glycerol-3-phosphate transport system substrate-binding protein
MDTDKIRYKPLYLQVKDVILKRIEDDVYKDGELIPSESKLAEEFGTSITTIRQALTILVNDGILVKKQGRGTFVSKQKTTLSFFTWIPETEQGEKLTFDIIELFQQKHPSFLIECIPTTYPAAKEELMKLITGGNAPDIVQIQSHWTSYFASTGALEQLDTLLDKDNLANRFHEKDLRGGVYQDTIYSVAWGLCPVALIVNKNVTGEAGIHHIESPMTLDTLFTLCKKIDDFYKNKGADKYSYGLSILSLDRESDFLTIYNFLQAFHGGLVNEQGEITFNSQANVAGFTWLREFANTCKVFKSNIFTIRRRFAQHDIAFITDGPWIKYLLEELTGEEFEKNFEVVLNPVQTSVESHSWTYNHALAICSQSQHKRHAARFINALTNEYEICQYYHSRTGLLPVNKKYLNDSLYTSEFFRAYKKQLQYSACINAQNAMFDKAMVLCIDAVKKILFEGVDIEGELNEKEYYLNMLYYG